ncbi:MAG TPA: type I 3-dehydroquinate dehydratase [Candidatus Bilamarchaeaceae archaeon]|nr:type I 3-dehydroquinate dehydratase [Candidatus Bilamarchaeaceae archaeon]
MDIVGCLSGKTAEECKKQIKKAVEQGATMVELRIDYLEKFDGVQEIIQSSPVPLIVTFRRKENGGLFEGNEKLRIETLNQAIKSGADYVDIELDAKDINQVIKTAKENNCQVIVSQHDFNSTPEIKTMQKWLVQASKLGDIVKIVPKANSTEDAEKVIILLEIARQLNIPIVSFAMGEKGKNTRAFSLVFGSKWTYCSIDNAVGPGQVSIKEMKEVLKDNVKPKN